MESGTSTVLSHYFYLLWRRRRVMYLCLCFTSAVAFLFYATVGERYDAYVLLRSGQGIKDRAGNSNTPFAEGIDLQSRMDSLSRIAKIDAVILEAGRTVGYDRLAANTNPTLIAPILAALRGIAPAKEPATPEEERDERERNESLALALRDRITAKQEGRSDLLRLTFRHADPSIAAEFLNEVANALVSVQNTEVQMPGAQEFFSLQTKRFENEAVEAAAALESFSVKASIYAVDDQRQLLLKRANDLGNLISTTRGAIQERKGQKQAIVEQLQVLRPVTQSKTVSRMVKTLSGYDPKKAAESATREQEQAQAQAQADEIPPLLLVKVYQDNMATLMKVNAELSGSNVLLGQLATELENVNKDLASLSASEAEYGRLKRALATASAAAAHYASKMVEEQISSEVAKKSQLSSLRVVQRAVVPTDPVFPHVPHIAGLALAGGILIGLAIIFVPQVARGTMPKIRPNRDGDADDELVDLLVARRRKEASGKN